MDRFDILFIGSFQANVNLKTDNSRWFLIVYYVLRLSSLLTAAIGAKIIDPHVDK